MWGNENTLSIKSIIIVMNVAKDSRNIHHFLREWNHMFNPVKQHHNCNECGKGFKESTPFSKGMEPYGQMSP